MTNKQIFRTLLEKEADPLLRGFSPDEQPSNDPILQLFKRKPIVGIQSDQAGYIDMYRDISKASIYIGDVIRYADQGSGDYAKAEWKTKKITEAIGVSGDQMRRVLQSQNAGVPFNIIGENIERRLKYNHAVFMETARQCALNPSNVFTDGDFQDLFDNTTSADGSLQDPYNLNSGSDLDETSNITFTGSNRTEYAMTEVLKNVANYFTVHDDESQLKMPVRQKYVGMHPKMYNVLKKDAEEINSTTGQRSNMTFLEQLVGDGWTPVQHKQFQSAFDPTSEDGEGHLHFFADPQETMVMGVVQEVEGLDQWSGWERSREDHDNGTHSYRWTTERLLEFGFHRNPYYISGEFVMPTLKVKFTYFDDA